MTYMAQRVSNFGTTIFFEMTSLANQHQAVNLGQGFPDFAGPDFLKQAAIKAIQSDVNQYAPGSGWLRLREAIARKMARHYGLPVDPATEISIYRGVPHTSPGRAGQLKVPLAVVRGHKSRVVMRHHVNSVGRMPLGESLTMPGGHMFPLERPQDTALLLKNLFSRWDGRRPQECV